MATILIVDDLSANRKFLASVLGDHGHRLVEAHNGRDALALVQAERPDLIITDVLMPVMDGYEFVRRLQVDAATRRIPVLFYTAPYGEREAAAFARSTGLPSVLRKPARPEEVLTIVSRVLSGSSEEPTIDDEANASDADRDHLQLLTDRLSDNAADLKDANARLRALINIGLDLSSSTGSPRLLEAVCEAACDLFGATYVTLGIVDGDTMAVRRFASWGTDATDWARSGDAIPGILATVVSKRRILRGDNAGGDPARLHLPASHPEVHAFLVTPIASRSRVYGWLCLVGNEDRLFTEHDEPMVMALAGQVGRVYELEYEILERKQAEAAVRQERDRAHIYLEAARVAEERMRFALEATGVGVWDMDVETGVVRWSEILEAQYGLEPGAFGGTLATFMGHIHPDDRASISDAVTKAMASGSDFSLLNRAIHPDGSIRWLSGAGRFQLDGDGRPTRGVGISQDVTERRRTEEQSQQSQKMEAIGQLAGGVAHDFNNLLTAILGYCELLQSDLAPGDLRLSDIAEIQKAGQSAASLTRQLLAFSRKQIIEPTLLDLNVIVTAMKPMLARLIREDVVIAVHLQHSVSIVKADRAQIEQILVNLAVNARDAMPGGGTLTIETADVELDEDYARAHAGVRAGPYVAITMSDTGNGVEPQLLAHLFEPFFTTKPVGKGTGLGLATVHGIATRSGGSVNVYSELGRGTSFKVYLPRARETGPVVDALIPIVREYSGAETVLVVEDAAGLRELTKRLLTRQGYNVLVAGDAKEALAVFERSGRIDLVLTDVVMPGASGPELTQQLVGLQPSLKVIFMSGYTEALIVRDGVLNPGIAFLQKPFTSDTLGSKIREVLDCVPAGASAE